MATIQITDARIKIEPTIAGATNPVEFGPSGTVASNSVLLTSDELRKVGAYPPRNGQDWKVILWVFDVISGVETARDLSNYALAGTYWDPVAEVANTLTVSTPGDATGFFTITFSDASTLVAGMYKFQITATDTDIFDLCSGWLEILPGVPS